jgi:hypothetical protein
MLRPGNLRKQPFLLRRLLPGPGTYEVHITLHLDKAIEAKYRTVKLQCTIDVIAKHEIHSGIADAATQRKKRRKIIAEQFEEVTVTTQEVLYGT